mgnify:CR=1 FL=1
MRKLKSLALLAFVALAVTACSGSKQDVEQAPEQELYSTGQTYLQKGDYSQAIRYLTAVDNRFPGSSYSEQVQLNLIYAYYKSQDYTEMLVTVDRFIQRFPHSDHLDYALYMAGLANSALGDNFFQDFFGVDRATRENTSIKTAFANYELIAYENDRFFNYENRIYRPFMTDQLLLKQLMTILFDNAIKYTEEDGKIEFVVHATDRHLYLTVTDNGIGISAPDKKKIFDRFYRVDKARTRQKGGFGLGLSLAKQIVDALRGTIAVKDNKPRGTIFEVKIAIQSPSKRKNK